MNPELPSSAMGTLRLMPQTALQVRTFGNQLIEQVKLGNVDPLELLVFLRAMTKVSENVLKEIEQNILTAADKYPGNEIEAYGAMLKKEAVKTDYNYASAGDIEWERLDAEIKALTERKKNREEQLRLLREPETKVSTDTGEIYEVRPPFKTVKEGIKVFLK